jgi:hypothetical protein
VVPYGTISKKVNVLTILEQRESEPLKFEFGRELLNFLLQAV